MFSSVSQFAVYFYPVKFLKDLTVIHTDISKINDTLLKNHFELSTDLNPVSKPFKEEIYL